MNNFWCPDPDCGSTASHSSEKFNTRMFLNIYFKIVPLLPQKRLISPPTAILFLYEKVLTERIGMLLMAQSGMCVDCYRIMWRIQQKGSLKHIFQNSFPSLPVKMAIFNTTPFCLLINKRKIKWNERGDLIIHTATACPFSYKEPFF